MKKTDFKKRVQWGYFRSALIGLAIGMLIAPGISDILREYEAAGNGKRNGVIKKTQDMVSETVAGIAPGDRVKVLINGETVAIARNAEEGEAAFKAARLQYNSEGIKPLFVEADYEMLDKESEADKALLKKLKVSREDELTSAIFNSFDKYADNSKKTAYTMRIDDYTVTMEHFEDIVSVLEDAQSVYDTDNEFQVSLNKPAGNNVTMYEVEVIRKSDMVSEENSDEADQTEDGTGQEDSENRTDGSIDQQDTDEGKSEEAAGEAGQTQENGEQKNDEAGQTDESTGKTDEEAGQTDDSAEQTIAPADSTAQTAGESETGSVDNTETGDGTNADNSETGEGAANEDANAENGEGATNEDANAENGEGESLGDGTAESENAEGNDSESDSAESEKTEDKDPAVAEAEAKLGADDGVKYIGFSDKIQVMETCVDTSEIKDRQTVLSEITAPVDEAGIYVVEPGDCLSIIAEKVNMSEEKIKELNEGIENDDDIYYDDRLNILVPTSPVQVMVEKQETYTEKYYADVEYQDDASMYIGETSVIQEGSPGTHTVTDMVTYKGDLESGRERVDEIVEVAAVAEVVLRGTKSKPTYMFPVTNWNVTSNFGYRWGRLHAGTDVGVPIGTTVRASRGGQVITAGWVGGYGNCVIIDHGDGVCTRYGHLSQVLVSVGQYVDQGDQIALSGNTGRSTGPHLHFEIRINGEAVDPLPYLYQTAE